MFHHTCSAPFQFGSSSEKSNDWKANIESEFCGAAETATQSAMLAIQTSPRPSKLSHQEVLKFEKHSKYWRWDHLIPQRLHFKIHHYSLDPTVQNVFQVLWWLKNPQNTWLFKLGFSKMVCFFKLNLLFVFFLKNYTKTNIFTNKRTISTIHSL